GLGRQLYPDLDLWQTAQPVLEEWMAQRRDPRTYVRELLDAWPTISEDARLLPRLLHRAIRRADMAEAPVRPPVRLGERPRHERRRERAHAGAALLIAGVLWSGL